MTITNIPKFTIEPFNLPVFLSHFHISEHCHRSRHSCIRRPVRNHSGVHRYDALSPSEPVSAMKNSSVPLLLLSIRTNAMPFVEVPRTPPLLPLQNLSPLRSRSGLWIESSSISALKSGCKFPVAFMPSSSVSPTTTLKIKTFLFSFLVLFLGLSSTPIFESI
jgi:hypothetical protein